MISIAKKITGWSIATGEEQEPARTSQIPAAADAVTAQLEAVEETINENMERPSTLGGETYKVKTPMSEHAMYVTINDVTLNAGMPTEHRRPFEIFINSKNMENFQWVVALTRVMSAVFRKGGDVAFMVGELKAIFDPRGGFWKPGGTYVPSVVAELGNILEAHLRSIDAMQVPELSAAQQALIEEKRAQLKARAKPASEPATSSADAELDPQPPDDEPQFPPNAEMCPKCSTRALVRADGCNVCLSCGYSHCGG